MVDRPAVEVEGVHAGYGSGPVLVDVSLTVPAGAGVCVTGENGPGKSTRLRCVSGLLQADQGVIRVFGGDPGATPEFWRAVVTTVEPPTWYPGLTSRQDQNRVSSSRSMPRNLS